MKIGDGKKDLLRFKAEGMELDNEYKKLKIEKLKLEIEQIRQGAGSKRHRESSPDSD
jgi:hypothetical protein